MDGRRNHQPPDWTLLFATSCENTQIHCSWCTAANGRDTFFGKFLPGFVGETEILCKTVSEFIQGCRPICLKFFSNFRHFWKQICPDVIHLSSSHSFAFSPVAPNTLTDGRPCVFSPAASPTSLFATPVFALIVSLSGVRLVFFNWPVFLPWGPPPGCCSALVNNQFVGQLTLKDGG